MARLLDKMRSGKPCLIVSIPTNSVEEALAAEAGGADAIKVHSNVTHHATGLTFGTLEQEEPRLRAIVEAVKIPVGLVPGETLDLTLDFFRRVHDIGMDMVDAFAQFMPALIYKAEGVDLAAATDSTYAWDEIQAVASLPWVDAIECAKVPTAEYGTYLSWRDVAYYAHLTRLLHKPIIIPTQRKIRLDDIPALLSVGVKNIMIGAIVTGRKVPDIERVTREFRQTMDATN